MNSSRSSGSVARSTRRIDGASSRSSSRWTSIATWSPYLETHAAELRGRRGGAVTGALLPVRRARRAHARLHARGRTARSSPGSANAATGRATASARSASSGAGRATCAGSAAGTRPCAAPDGRRDTAELEAKYLDEPRRRRAHPGPRHVAHPRYRARRGHRQGDARAARGRGRRRRRAHRPHPRRSAPSRASTPTSFPAGRGRARCARRSRA